MTRSRAILRGSGCAICLILLTLPGFAQAQRVVAPVTPSTTGDVDALRAELAEARALLADQNRQLAEQQRRLDAMEQRLSRLADLVVQPDGTTRATAVANASGSSLPSIQVGEAPVDADRAPPVAVLDQQGSVVTRQGQLVAELGFDYTRADRNRAIFRGVELFETVLVGVFDINESRQDILSASGALRYGLTNRLEIGVRLPFIYRADKLVTTPVAGSSNNGAAQTIDNSVSGSGLGDIELSARYQLNDGGQNIPFLIANLQATLPTGRDPFSVSRDANGVAQQVSTGAGFWGISPSITAILPSEPAVLFATVGYTFNLGRNVSTRIPPVQIDRIEPGDQISASAGVGLALNDRTSLNFGYIHAWSFGTRTTTRVLDKQSGEPTGNALTSISRDLQIGRFLFGVSHRFSDAFQLNWTVEIGATQDAPDMRTSIRIPFTF